MNEQKTILHSRGGKKAKKKKWKKEKEKRKREEEGGEKCWCTLMFTTLFINEPPLFCVQMRFQFPPS